MEKLRLEDSPLRWSCNSLASVSSRNSFGSPVSRDTAVLELETEETREERTELLHTPITHPLHLISKTANTSRIETPPRLKQSEEPEMHQKHRHSRSSRLTSYSTPSRHSQQSTSSSFSQSHAPLSTNTPLSSSHNTSSSYISRLRSMHTEQASLLSQQSLGASVTSLSMSIPTLWKVDNHMQEFTYITPKNNILLHTSHAIMYFCQLKTNQGSRYYRLSVVKSAPLYIHLLSLSAALHQDVTNLLLLQDVNSGLDVTNHTGQLLPPQSSTSPLITVVATSKHAISQLPNALRAPYHFVSSLLSLLPSKLPKLTLYLRSAVSTSSRDNIYCKCVLMSNLPLPDFLVRFANALKIHYSLDSNHLTIYQPDANNKPNIYYENDLSSSSNWCQYAPKQLQKYIITAQKAMQQCLVLCSDGMRVRGSRIVMGQINEEDNIVIDGDN